MRILALDIATNTGGCFGSADARVPLFMSQRFAVTGQSFGPAFLKFDRWLDDLITVHAPDVLAFEAPLVQAGRGGAKVKTNVQTVRLLMGLASVADMVGARRGLRTFEANVATIKKSFTGSGRADKDAMKRMARARGWPIKNDHEADAGALWAYAVACFAPDRAAAQTALFSRIGAPAA